MKRLAAAILLVALLPIGVAAQDKSVPIQDEPKGAPYNTASPDNSSVSLRDFLASRIDQNRTELLERLDEMDKAHRELIDERDKQYAERDAAAKQAIRDTLAASEKAAAKTEADLTKRFESVNEFRNTLADQAQNFMTKSEVLAIIKGVEEKFEVRSKANEDNSSRNAAALADIASRAQGASSLWILITTIIGAFVVLAGFILAMFNRQRAVPK